MTRARDLSRLANTNAISVDANNNIGVGSLTPTAKLDVVGVVSATSFYGDGSNLINAGSSLASASGSQRVVLTSLTSGTMTSAATNSDLLYDSSTNTLSATTFSGALSGNATGLSGSPSITITDLISTGNVSIAGTITYEDVTNVDSVGLITARSGIEISGIVTARSGFAVTYYGDGSQLEGISAGIGTEASSGGLVTLNLTSAQDHKVTATGITTITVSGGTEGDSHTVRIVNSGIATVGFSTYFLFPSGSPPVLPTASAAISLVSFTVNRVGAAGTQLLAGAGLNYQ